MATTIFAAIGAAWLTGMIPIAAVDACDPDWDRVTPLQRFFVYWTWPLWLPLVWNEPAGDQIRQIIGRD